MSTHKCAVDWGTVGGSDLKADGTADIDTERGGVGRVVIGRKERTVDEIVRRKLDGWVVFTGLRWALS